MSTTSALYQNTRTNRNPGWWKKRWGAVSMYTGLVLIGLFLFMPIFWLLVASLKVDSEFITYPIHWFPEVPQWSNYIQIFTLTDFVPIALRTASLALTTAVISTLVNAMAGFAFARYPVKGSHQLFAVIVAMMIVPGIVFMIPHFLIFSRLKLLDTYWPWYIGAVGGSSFGIFLFRQFFLGFPKEIEEAAEVDGCGPFRMFWQIFIPNAKPAIAVLMINGFNYVWGDYLTPALYLSAKNTLLPVVLANSFRNPQGYVYLTITMAANVIYVLPLVIIFFVAQKQILKGVVTSGLKG